MLLLDMGSSGKLTNTSTVSSAKAPGKKANQLQHHKPGSSEARLAAKESKTQQDELESLQITFYEIEAWIEKTTPVLTRMTKELDKASRHFDKRRKETQTEEQKDSTAHSHGHKHPPQPQPPPPHGQLPRVQQPQPNPQLQPPQHTTTPRVAQPSSDAKDNDNAMKWVLSFQPGNSLRLETNITSVDQLVEAVHKISILTESDPQSGISPDRQARTRMDLYDTLSKPNELHSGMAETDDIAPSSSSSSSGRSFSIGVNPLETDPSTEYWHLAIHRRPQTCLENYKHCEMDLGRLTEDVSPSVLNYICQVYWDCLHPKFSCDWYSFWDRSGDPKRNQVCIDSGLAVVFLHVIRHQKNVCANALDIAYYYYDRARESLMEFFDTPDCATLETLLNLSLFCMVCKRHSQARIYMSLAFRMMLGMEMHRRSRLPTDRVLCKKYLKLFMVLYYNDINTTIYSGEAPIVNDDECDIDFYEVLDLNKVLFENGEGGCDDNMIAKETYFVHTLELARINKRIRKLTKEFQPFHALYQTGELPMRWAKKILAIEVSLAQWYDRLPDYYRVDPQLQPIPNTPASEEEKQHHPMSSQALTDHANLLLMLQYQTQWIMLHKPFLCPSGSTSPFTKPSDFPSPTSPTSPGAHHLPQQHTDRSHAICTDAANRIVAVAELITQQYGWCVCQQFIDCIYQASTIYCRNALSKDEALRQNATGMIHRIIRVLASTRAHYQGLPDDLTACLNDFLANHNMSSPNHDGQQDGFTLLNQFFSSSSSWENTVQTRFNDNLPNSPHMYRHILTQHQSLASTASHPKEAMFPKVHHKASSCALADRKAGRSSSE